MVLSPGADEGGSPEVDPVPDLLRLDEVTEVWILVPKADFPEVKEGPSQGSVIKKKSKIKT